MSDPSNFSRSECFAGEGDRGVPAAETHCPLHNWTTGAGRDVVPLNVTKTYYFISGNGFCYGILKVAIPVEELPLPPKTSPIKSGSLSLLCRQSRLKVKNKVDRSRVPPFRSKPRVAVTRRKFSPPPSSVINPPPSPPAQLLSPSSTTKKVE
nr:lamin-like protein [Ipomoea trifida]